jgi:L-lactate dehydrogenase (cytochrome)
MMSLRSLMIPASFEDYRALARRRLPRELFAYIDGGSFDEETLAANRRDLLAVRLRPRVLQDVSTIDTRATLLGYEASLPVALAPVGLGGLAARRGEVQAVRAAAALGVPFCLSTVALCSIEEVRAATSAPFWFQLYMTRDRGYAKELLQRAQAAKCSALLLTVDLAVRGTRYRDVRLGNNGGLSLAGRAARAVRFLSHPGWLLDVGVRGRPLAFGNLSSMLGKNKSLFEFGVWSAGQFASNLTWQDLDWIRQHWQGPLVLKGVADLDDARTAAAAGVQGLIVSNHGGRQLDSAPSTISVLPPIADAVGDRLELVLDGGVRGGQDVVKALALGARAVMIGRAWVWALAAGGEQGVKDMLAIIRRDLEATMALIGRTRTRDLTPEAIHRD